MLLDVYRAMTRIRQTEEELARCHQRGLIHGACHTYVGQEAIAASIAAHLRFDDVVFSTHRGHGHALAKGMEPRQLMAELFGRATGCSYGRGGSMHLFQPEIGVMGTSGIVGPCILQAAGAGYSFKLLRTDRVAVAFFGDGAANNGAFHEGLNLAGIWGLPVIFVCENNQFATEVPYAYSGGGRSIAARGANYGMVGLEVDGNDAVLLTRMFGEAVARARSGGGPTLVECQTYRTRAHAEGMGDFTYRTREEVEQWKSRCPIQRLRAHLIANGQATAAQLDEIDARIAADVVEARQFAENSPWPDAATATNHVYAADSRSVPSSTASPAAAHPPTAPLAAVGSAAAGTIAGATVSATSVTTGADAPGAKTAAPRELTWTKAAHEALSSAMARDATIFVLGEGIGKRGGNFMTTVGLFDLYGPERLRDTPICERGFVGLAGGAAMTGTRPVVDFMFADFVLDSVGEIVNQIAKMQYMSSGRLRMPVLLRGCIGIGHSAATHHSGSYYAMYANIPGLRVVVPSNARDAKGLLAHALRCFDPVLFLEHRELLSTKCEVPEEDYEIPFGIARVAREGRDATIVALARMVPLAVEVAGKLAAEGIEIEVIDPRTVSPLDTDTIVRSVAKTGRLLVVDEAFAPCGFAAEVVARVADAGFDELDAPIRRLHGAFAPTPYSPPLEAAVVPNAAMIEQAVRDLLAE
jgi:2-oxoisovalerate dehydrogenase E1 component